MEGKSNRDKDFGERGFNKDSVNLEGEYSWVGGGGGLIKCGRNMRYRDIQELEGGEEKKKPKGLGVQIPHAN